jgi:hypothetical protein
VVDADRSKRRASWYLEVMDRDDAISAITDAARAQRRKPSRALWITAAVIGIVAVIGFVALMLADASAPTKKPTGTREGGTGFTIGLIVGGALGIAIGYTLARHSSRKRP